jgi:flagellar P-ring protein FlgI
MSRFHKRFSMMRLPCLAMFLVLATIGMLQPQLSHAARLKDIADVEGVRGNQLFGYGIVVGLNGTGDGNAADFTSKGLSNILERAGLSVDSEDIRVKNVASVLVTATLPAFIRPGSRIDVTISSLGDAKSLQGGTLLFAPLKGADGNVYAVAQGAVVVGGFSVESGQDAAIRNHPTVGQITNGATVERAIPFDLFQSQQVRIVLRNPDFSTMTRVVTEINRNLGRPLAVALDSASVEIPLVDEHALDPVGFLARIEQIDVPQDFMARVVVNEKTGTIVIGENVTVSRVALAHGNLNIVIRAETQVSQPQALAQTGTTEVVTNTDVTVGEDQSGLSIVGGSVTLGELVDALNALGATPRDLISIFNALQQAGALQAELTIM